MAVNWGGAGVHCLNTPIAHLTPEVCPGQGGCTRFTQAAGSKVPLSTWTPGCFYSWVILNPLVWVSSAEGERVWRSQCCSSERCSIQQLLRKPLKSPRHRAGKGSRGSAKPATYSLQPKVFPLAPLYWMEHGEKVEGPAKNPEQAAWCSFKRSHFHRAKGSINPSVMGCILSVSTGKQHLCGAGTVPGVSAGVWMLQISSILLI